jgi:FtsP/CotA-like multicopper oxidase with cupredoxin domain
MDGTPGVTQAAIGPGEKFIYRFVAPDPGTYWFHPHSGTQLDPGHTDGLLPRRSISCDFEAGNPGQWMMHCHDTYHAQGA